MNNPVVKLNIFRVDLSLSLPQLVSPETSKGVVSHIEPFLLDSLEKLLPLLLFLTDHLLENLLLHTVL